MKMKKEEPKPEVQTAAAPAPKFTLEKLRNSCRELFKITQSTFDGATHGLSGEYTVSEMKSVIAAWQRKEVR